MLTEKITTALHYLLLTIAVGMMFFLHGCATWTGEKGVENNWRNPDLPTWEIGKTTDMDVAKALGPPSQIIPLEDQIVFYYMQEQSQGRAYIFILWNKSDETIRYDRAVFFFDKKGILKKYAYSPEAFLYDENS